jgi:oxygen-independent coproporphyrinogen III oxidase
MKENLHILMERGVPRYTSYPTAPQFSPAVGAEKYRAWLAQLPAGAKLSIYLHVPYCSQLCLYCGCHTKIVRRYDPVGRYANSLLKELALLGEVVGSRKVVHIHWGGGTPSILGSEKLTQLAGILRETFDHSELCEHAIELDPRHVTKPLAQSLAAMGVNRASLGVQDFSPVVQAAIGRIQSFETVREAVERLRDAGIYKISLDLMYGLPFQSIPDLQRTIKLAHSLEPDRVAVFGYAHVPWFKKHQRLIDEDSLPDSGQRFEQFQAMRAQLLWFGYEQIGFDHFALPSDSLARAASSRKLRRNFQGYSTNEGDALIGVGASAISGLPRGFAQNSPDILSYAYAIENGRLATVKGVELNADDQLRGAIIGQLMCEMSVDLQSVIQEQKSACLNDFAPEINELRPFEAAGLIEIDGLRIRVTEKGRPFVRLVAAVFDSYLHESGGGRYSKAI